MTPFEWTVVIELGILVLLLWNIDNNIGMK